MNTIAITGNLVEDPTPVVLPDGKTLANFRIGNSERINGEDRQNGFFDVTAFGDLADNVLNKTVKGSRVVVVGRIQHRTFEREDGSKGGRTGLVASAVGLSLEFKPKAASVPVDEAPPAEEAPPVEA